MKILRQEDGALQAMLCRILRPSIVNALVTDAIARSPRARRSAVAGFVTLIYVPNVRRFGSAEGSSAFIIVSPGSPNVIFL
jgi:hypothetical protein